jgi:hypothetical protein
MRLLRLIRNYSGQPRPQTAKNIIVAGIPLVMEGAFPRGQVVVPGYCVLHVDPIEGSISGISRDIAEDMQERVIQY